MLSKDCRLGLAILKDYMKSETKVKNWKPEMKRKQAKHKEEKDKHK